MGIQSRELSAHGFIPAGSLVFLLLSLGEFLLLGGLLRGLLLLFAGVVGFHIGLLGWGSPSCDGVSQRVRSLEAKANEIVEDGMLPKT